MSGASGKHQSRPSLEDKDYARSSFYQAFYAGPNQTALNDFGGGGGSMNGDAKPSAASASAAAVSPRTLQRGMSRKQMTPAARRASSLTKRTMNFPAVREESGGGSQMSGGNHADIDSIIPPSLDREESWVVDLRRQQEAMEAGNGNGVASAHASAVVGDGGGDDDHGFGDMEVREQFRILAQHEAATRVRENMGFDPLSDPRSKKMIDASKDDTMRSTRHSLPKPAKPPMRDARPPRHVARPRAPPQRVPPPPREHERDAAASAAVGGTRVPELCPGVLTSDDVDRLGTMNEDEHVVRCLGCKKGLKVKKLATLVSCPDCQIVSPASSTRR